jgi:hypothetical protein
MQTKLAEQAFAVLQNVGPALRALSEENTALKEKVAYYQKKDKVEKLAADMHSKNLDPDTSFEQKVEGLMEQPDDQLEVVQKAVDLSAQQIKVAALSDHPGNGSDAKTAFETAILSE